MAKLPAVLCVDVEPDPRQLPVPDDGPWTGFEDTFARRDELREAFGDDGGVLNWFVRIDPQVEIAYGDPLWAVERYGDRFEHLTAAGDEIGAHAHCWRWDADAGTWVVHHDDPAWVEQCASMGIEGYERSFGRPCRVYRHGDKFMSTELARLLRASSVEVDLTLEPGNPPARGLVEREATTGALPAIHPTLSQPYEPSAESFDLPDVPTGALTMVPLTASPVPGWSGVDTLILWSDPKDFAVRLDLRLLDPDLTHLAFALRTEAASDPLVWSNVLTNVGRVAERCEVEWVGGSSFAGRATSHAGFEGIGTLGAMALEVSDLQRHFDVTGPPSLGVRDLEAELAAARAEVDELKEECAHLAWKLDVTKASRWWQLRERLLPLLVPLARIQRRSNPEWHEYRASNPFED